MTVQMSLTHWMMASWLPDMVTSLSVELGRRSPATCTWAPVVSLISLILEPPLPMSEPHWLAGMTNRKVTGGLLVIVPLATRAVRSSSSLNVIIVKARNTQSVGPVMVMILSGQEPSEMLILAVLSSRILFTVSPFLPIMLPTSLPCISSRRVSVTPMAPSPNSCSQLMVEVEEVVWWWVEVWWVDSVAGRRMKV